MRDSARKDYWTPESRSVPTAYAKGLIPALTFGYMFPTILMFVPFDLNITQGFVAFWQITPFVINMLLFNTASIDEQRAAAIKGISSTQNDVGHLKNVYIVSGAVAALVHVYTMIVTLTATDPLLSFSNAILRVPVSEQMPLSQALHYIFQVDFWIIFASSLVGAYLTLWDLKKIGKANLSLIQTAGSIALATVVIGPGATLAGVWYVREEIMTWKEKN